MRRNTWLPWALAIAAVVIAGLGAYALRAQPDLLPALWFRLRGSDPGGAPPQAAGAVGAVDGASALPPGVARSEVAIDPRRRQLIAVRLVPVERTRLTRTIRAAGLVAYDETRLTDVNVRVEGWIEELYVDYTGKPVNQGDALFALYSPDLLATQNEYLLALRARDGLQQSQIADARHYADRLVEAARQRLELWGLPADQVQALDESRRAQPTTVFRSPASGHVIEKAVVKGQRVSPGATVYRLADLSRIWIEADLYEQEIEVVRVGQQAVVTVDAYPGREFRARVVYIYPYLNNQTRTVRIRLELPNPDGRLKPAMYASVSLEAPLGTGLAIPTNALLDAGGQEQIVFVSRSDGVFEPRRVRVGHRLQEQVEILDGLAEGELVAASAAFFIDSESQLRAALQGFEAPAAMGVPASAGQPEIEFRTRPDPPRAGTTTFEVEVRDAEGRPVTDADVSVLFYMAAMPTMNMPAMQTEAALAHAEPGVYRGTGQIAMGGRWDVTVTVSRGGERIGRRQFSVVAR